MVLNSTYDADAPDPEQTIPATPILDRSSLVFHHVKTNKKLHSHDVRASVTEVDYQNEVSAYGFDGFTGDANDQFTIEIDQDESDVGDGNESKDRLQALRSKFRLRHELTGCYLFSHKVKLPDWGFEQQEVTCNKNPSKENGLWYVETNEHPACKISLAIYLSALLSLHQFTSF
jgi:dolichyl-phosphate-mannose-protein mannosyltransferase